jgi:hypothetical protein
MRIFTDVESEIVHVVVGPGAGVEVKNDMVSTVVPVLEVLDARLHVAHIVAGQVVPVQGVERQHKQTRLLRVGREKARLEDHVKYFAICRTRFGRVVQRVHVHLELAAPAPRHVKARLHPAVPQQVFLHPPVVQPETRKKHKSFTRRSIENFCNIGEMGFIMPM